MRERWTLVAGLAVAFVAPAVWGQERPTATHAVGQDGSVYYAVRSEGVVMKAAPDGSAEVVANGLDAPSGVALDTDGNLLIADEVGTHRLDFAAGTLAAIQAEPTAFEPQVRFDQAAWTYRPRKGSVRVIFAHNLKDLAPLFDIEVSKNGGRSWRPVVAGLIGTSYVWRNTEDWPVTQARFRVTAYVQGRRVASDVSDRYGDDVSVSNVGGSE